MKLNSLCSLKIDFFKVLLTQNAINKIVNSCIFRKVLKIEMMKLFSNLPKIKILFGLFFLLIFSPNVMSQDTTNYKEYSGLILDSETNKPLEAASLIIKNSNISSISNSEGTFILKVPESNLNDILLVSYLGYHPNEIKISSLSETNNKIILRPKITLLTEVNLLSFENAEELVRTVFDKRTENNPTKAAYMTAFYRETIKRRNRNVSLTEAVVNLYKQPYNSDRRDIVILNKARKSTDYRRLDTISFKLQGGPFSTLFLDIMKYPEYIFTAATINNYNFQFEPPTAVNGKPAYVVSFDQRKSISEPLYRGTLYIDGASLALTNADYNLNVENKKRAADLFVERKPRDVNVIPLKAQYHVDYREKDGKWHYGYGSVALSFKVTKKRKLFNQVYSLAAEMAVTDWEGGAEDIKGKYRNRLKPTVVLNDAISGFSDKNFWGAYNVIEPEKSIESAINKIQKRLKRSGS